MSWIPPQFDHSNITMKWFVEDLILKQQSQFIKDLSNAMTQMLAEKDTLYRLKQRDISSSIVKSQLQVIATLCKYGQRKGVLYYVKDDGTLGTFDTVRVDPKDISQFMNDRSGEKFDPTDFDPQRNMLMLSKGLDPKNHIYTEDDVRELNLVQQCSNYSKDWLSTVERSDLDNVISKGLKKEEATTTATLTIGEDEKKVLLNIIIPELEQYDIKDNEEEWETIRDGQFDNFMELFTNNDDLRQIFPDVKRNEQTVRTLWNSIWKDFVYPFYHALYNNTTKKSFQTYMEENQLDNNAANGILKEVQQAGEIENATIKQRIDAMNRHFEDLTGIQKVERKLPQSQLKTKEAQLLQEGLKFAQGLMGEVAKNKGVKPITEDELMKQDRGIYRGGEIYEKLKNANREFFLNLKENERVTSIRRKVQEMILIPFDKRFSNFREAIMNMYMLQGRNDILDDVARLCVSFINNPGMFTKQYLTFSLTGSAGTGKTELARRLSAVLASLGILIEGFVTQTFRSNFVAQYLGETADKTNTLLKSNLENVVFVDEAYSIAQGTDNTFDAYGIEALNEMTGFLDKNRGSIAIIVAGYKCQMDAYFFGANPGLQRRFMYNWNLLPYAPEHLLQILTQFMERSGNPIDQSLSPAAWTMLATFMTYEVTTEDADPGVFDEIIATLQNQTLIDELSKINVRCSQVPPGKYLFRRMFENEAGDMENLASFIGQQYNGTNNTKLSDVDILRLLLRMIIDRDGNVDIRNIQAPPAASTCVNPKFPAIFRGIDDPLTYVYNRLKAVSSSTTLPPPSSMRPPPSIKTQARPKTTKVTKPSLQEQIQEQIVQMPPEQEETIEASGTPIELPPAVIVPPKPVPTRTRGRKTTAIPTVLPQTLLPEETRRRSTRRRN